MTIHIEQITVDQAEKIRLLDEGQFADVKAREKLPSALSEDISAFANADGGDLYIGITDKERQWIGFDNVEAANAHLQVFEELFPLGTYFNRMEKSGLIEKVPGTKTSSTAWRKKEIKTASLHI